MNKIKLLLKYISPYKRPAINSVIFNILSALFALISYTLAIPFLKILFNRVESVPHPGEFQVSFEYLNEFFTYYLSMFIDKNGQVGALMLVSIIFIGSSLLKNGFVFLGNNSMAFIRASTVLDLRKKLYNKVLNLSLSYFTDTRKGDIITRVSNDLHEI